MVIGIPVVVLLAACLIYPPTYVFRVAGWGEADVADYQRFPARSVRASGKPYYFKQALDEGRIRSLFKQAGQDNLHAFLAETGTQAFLVIQDDTILYEGYFNGATRDSVVTSFSMAKSFTSALIGIAIAEGDIASVDDPITQYLPELAERDRRFAAITIRDLLRMSSGIRYEEFPFLNGDDAKTYYYPNLRHLALRDTEIVDVPGTSFLYNNYHPLLLGMILERATRMPVTTYLQEKNLEADRYGIRRIMEPG
jgi:CubicO group peptidase (beta-lactamase class C family)